jgi:hypothetical protein
MLVQSRGSFPFFAHQHVLHSSLKASKGLQVKSSAVNSVIVTSFKGISKFVLSFDSSSGFSGVVMNESLHLNGTHLASFEHLHALSPLRLFNEIHKY